MATRPVEILALPAKLHELFDGHVPAATKGTAEEREKNFLSRALAAYTVHKLAGATVQEAAAAIVDGGNDGGIDAVYASPATNAIWLVQSKFTDDGMSEPGLQEVGRFASGVEDLLAQRLDEFRQNPSWAPLLPVVEALLKNAATRIRTVLVYSGLRLISEDRKRRFEALRQQVVHDDNDDFFDFTSVNLTTINDWISGGDQPRGVSAVELEIIRPSRVTEPYDTVFGLVSLKSLHELHQAHGKALVAANLRAFKGLTEVNEEIQKTVSAEPALFLYLNNGMTAYCDRLEDDNRDRLNHEKKRYTARGFSIINGAQTLGAVVSCFAGLNEGDAPPDGYAFIKIVSLERCEDDRAFADRISRTANFQNQVRLRDFAAAYGLHEQIARTLEPHNVHYHYKIADDTPDGDDENFDMEEALTACACLKNTNDCDLVTRVAANRDSLRSLDMVFPPEDLLRSRHERVFPPDLSARTAWRAVQAQRIVKQVMGDSARASTGALKSFYANARWVVLAAVFTKLKPQDGEPLALSADEAAAISAAVSDYAEKLLSVCVAKGIAAYDNVAGQQVLRSTREFQSVFKTQGDCQTLFAALKAEIWNPQNQALPAMAAPQGDNV